MEYFYLFPAYCGVAETIDQISLRVLGDRGTRENPVPPRSISVSCWIVYRFAVVPKLRIALTTMSFGGWLCIVVQRL